MKPTTEKPDKPLRTFAQQLEDIGNAYKQHPGRWERIYSAVAPLLLRNNVVAGTMLEIGGRENPRHESFPQFAYTALDLDDTQHGTVAVMKGDITDCPHIPDEQFDFIFSLDVFEHIDKPWLAAAEISRLLKPGGITFHSTLFSWRYHPCPVDFWRYSPAGLSSLFPKLEQLLAEFDYTERRRNIKGKGGNLAPMDQLGGWRENVRVHYAGRKPI